MKKKYIFLTLILIQISIIGILFQQITHKKNVLGTVSINPIQKETIVSSPSGKLHYFYELKPDSIIKPEIIFPGLENISYHINKDGFNQLNDYPIEKKTGTYRIVTLGDSHTFGQNLNTEDNYPSQLQQLLNEKLSCPTIQKFEVINLGVYAYDIQYTVERFKRRGQKYHPNLVIWLVVSDDFRRINEVLLPKMRQYTKEAKENGNYEKQLANGEYNVAWNKARDEIVEENGGKAKVLQFQKNQMERINTYYSGKLLLTTYENTLVEEDKQLLKIFSEERKDTFFHDQLPNIYETAHALLPDRHANRYGYQLIAETLMAYLLDEKILNCSMK